MADTSSPEMGIPEQQSTNKPGASPTQDQPNPNTSTAAQSSSDPTNQPAPGDSTTSTPTEPTDVPPTSTSPTSTPPEETSTSAESPSSSTPSPTPTSTPPTTSESEEPTSSSTTGEPTSTEVTSTEVDSTTTNVVVVTTTREQTATEDPTTTATAAPTPIDPAEGEGGGGGGGLSSGAKVAVGVVVPIAAIAILALVALFFWRKRKARRAAAEERRKEVEDYSYNPNADPTIPNVGMGASDGGYEMREDTSGYRGWGTTVGGSTGRKPSTTMSGGGLTYSDPASPTQGHTSLSRSDEVYSPEGEILGAMGPAAANNRGTGVNRGPSNASSAYSAANRSDNSDGAMSYGNGATYYDQHGQNPYSDPYGGAPELPGQPVIRDNPARRNTRIENPSHYPQQSAGISQNF